MSTGQIFATLFCAFRFATFLHKSSPQKIAGYMGVSNLFILKKLDMYKELIRNE
jgi:hypothetical protein